jgi:adenylate cyclase
VDKYIGDALMACFGTLEEEVDAEYRSVCAAMEFKETIREMNKERRRLGKDPISIGVGVNTGTFLYKPSIYIFYTCFAKFSSIVWCLGPLLAGFIGSTQRLEYTCIGDSVNTASRISDLSKRDQVLISEFTYEKVRDWVTVQPIGPKQFKGKNREVGLIFFLFKVHLNLLLNDILFT